jgi:hypothetical protein
LLLIYNLPIGCPPLAGKKNGIKIYSGTPKIRKKVPLFAPNAAFFHNTTQAEESRKIIDLDIIWPPELILRGRLSG